MERPTPRPILSDTESPGLEPGCEEVVALGDAVVSTLEPNELVVEVDGEQIRYCQLTLAGVPVLLKMKVC